MENNFLSNFSANTKVWIYQSAREFGPEEISWIEKESQAFIERWNAHGAKVKASFTLLNNRFLVIASDQDFTANSGCSIDSMVGFIRAVQTYTKLDLMNRMLVHYQKDGELHSCDFREISSLVESGELSNNTMVYNPLVNTKQDFQDNWLKPLSEGWLARFASKADTSSGIGQHN